MFIRYFFEKVKFGLRTVFITGIAVLFPIVITIYIGYFLYNIITRITSPVVRYILHNLLGLGGVDFIAPIFGFVLVIIVIFTAGFLATNYFGKKIISLGERLLLQIPILSGVFSAAKQFLSALSISNKKGFSKVVLIEYPRKGIYTLGFLTTSAHTLLRSNDNIESSDLVYVFIPTTPNPTSGWLSIVKKSDLIYLDIKIEDAIKLIISGGLVHPGELERLVQDNDPAL